MLSKGGICGGRRAGQSAGSKQHGRERADKLPGLLLFSFLPPGERSCSSPELGIVDGGREVRAQKDAMLFELLARGESGGYLCWGEKGGSEGG